MVSNRKGSRSWRRTHWPPICADARQGAPRSGMALGMAAQVASGVFSRAPVELVRAIVRRLGADGDRVATVKLEGRAAAHILNPAAVPSHTDRNFTFERAHHHPGSAAAHPRPAR